MTARRYSISHPSALPDPATAPDVAGALHQSSKIDGGFFFPGETQRATHCPNHKVVALFSAKTRGERNMRKRSSKGEGLPVGVRCHSDLLSELDAWRLSQPCPPCRAAALRRLAELSLERLRPADHSAVASEA